MFSLPTVSPRSAREVRRHRKERLRQARAAKWRFRLRRLRRAILATAAILVGAITIAFFGWEVEGFLLTAVAMIVTFCTLALFPRTRRLSGGTDLPGLVKRTQQRLERRRRDMPVKERVVIDVLASRLDSLSPQLTVLEEHDPANREVRKLLGEHLQSLIDNYDNIPEHLRQKPHAGSSPHAQFAAGLATITFEVERIGSAIARGKMDDLAVRGRYLEARYPIVQDDSAIG